MKKLITLSSLLAVTVISGCSSMGYGTKQYYDGPKLAPSETAIIYSKNVTSRHREGAGITILAINDREQSFVEHSSKEVLPGTHKIKFACSADSENQMTGKYVGHNEAEITVSAGRIYHLYGHRKSLPRTQWFYRTETMFGIPKKFLQQEMCILRIDDQPRKTAK